MSDRAIMRTILTLFGLLSTILSLFGAAAQPEKAQPFQLQDTICMPWLDAFEERINVTVKVCYSSSEKCLRDGEIIHAMDTQEVPKVFICGNDLNQTGRYALVVLDTDDYTPENPVAKNTVHLLISDIDGSTNCSQDIAETGKVIVEYVEAHRPYFFDRDMGTHDFYVLLFQQESGTLDMEPLTWNGRFSMRDFAQKYDLDYPVSGMLYKVKYGSYH
ncbi:hypothetical protein KP509_34G007800 [Ceratopteris richardii]|uniref:Uncharacterized protein n=1 Tax=Ceratopteris richardii TaxID=49495 RepID=A0A8T2QIT8_CERRI|nr:hypothetical protein KP509_34G007800 [Ceratopteris richardii]